jgi:hypothetical protein
MKKLIILIVSIIFYTCSTSSDPNEADPTISLSPAASEVSVNGQSTLSLMIQDNQKSFFGISLQVDFNNSVLNFSDSTGFTPGDLFDQNAVNFVRKNGSTIHLSMSQLNGQSSANGSGKICTLTFSAAALGNSIVEINQNDLLFYDSNGNEITIPNLKIGSASVTVK